MDELTKEVGVVNDDVLEGVKYVYCMAHLRAHEVGWCTVGRDHKIALWAQTRDQAIEEVRRRNFPVYEGESLLNPFTWDISGGIKARR